jgi:hypothetical protein
MNTNNTRSRAYALCLLLIAASLSASCRSTPDPSVITSYGSFSVRSSGSGQLSSDSYVVAVTTSGVLRVNYSAPRQHCASIRIHFLVDGTERAVSAAISPGAKSGYVDLGPVAPGTHEIAVQGEGVDGGCDHGRLSSWEGSIDVWTSAPSRPVTHQPAPTAALLFKSSSTTFGWGYKISGCCIASDGSVSSYRYAKTPSTYGLSNGNHSARELLGRYCPGATRVGSIPADEVSARGADLAKASAEPVNVHAYAGGTTRAVVGYRLESGSGQYSEVRLLGDGAAADADSSPSAAALLDWIHSTLIRTGCVP